MSTQREAFHRYMLDIKGWRVDANYAKDGTFISYVRDDVQDCWEAYQAGSQAHAEQSKSSEYCCEHSWKHARDTAWRKRDFTKCNCDHNESCDNCFPPEFKTGGKWDLCKPQPPKEEKL